jgi:hypothetical protein
MKLIGKKLSIQSPSDLTPNASLVYHSKPVIRISTFIVTSFTTHATVQISRNHETHSHTHKGTQKLLSYFFFYEGPSHHSFKAFCATPLKMMRMSSFFLPIFTINGAPAE